MTQRRPLTSYRTVQDAFTIDDLGDVVNDLHPVAAKWNQTGLSLGMKSYELDCIRNKFQGDCNAYLSEMLKERLCRETLKKQEIVDALKSPNVGQTELSERLRIQYGLPKDTAVSNNLQHDDATGSQLDRIFFISKNLYPYNYILQCKYFTVDVFALFITLQILSVFDDQVFRPDCYSRGDYINQIVFFLLRVFLTIVTPTVCFAQLRVVCSKKTRTSSYHMLYREEKRLLKERNLSLCCTALRQPSSWKTVQASQQPRRISSWKNVKAFQPLIHALILPFILYYFSIFKSTYPSQPKNELESWRHKLQIYAIQVLEVWDCHSIFLTLLLSGVLKDLFCLENHLATLPCSNSKVFRAIRNRWLLIDWYLCLDAIVLAVLTFTVLIFGVPFTPSYITLNAHEQHYCNVLAVAITLLQLAGSSPWPAMKIVSVVACCVISPIAVGGYYTGSIGLHIAPGSITLLLYTTQAVTLINWLLCLICCYWRHNELKIKSYSTYSCLLSLCSVSVCLFCIVCREFRWNNPKAYQ